MSRYSVSGRKDRLTMPDPYLQYLHRIRTAGTKKKLSDLRRYIDINMNLTNDEVNVLNNLIMDKIKELEEK